MVSKTIELLLEYMALILCIHKVAKQKFKLNVWLIVLFAFEWIFMMLITEEMTSPYCRMLIHVCLLIYTKKKVVETWGKAIGAYGISLIITMAFQILFYYCFKVLLVCNIKIQNEEILSNSIICCLLYFWKEKYSNVIIKYLYHKKEMVIALVYAFVLFRILHLCNQNGYATFEISMQFLIETIGVSIAAILWISAETKNEHKEMEVQMYETYNKAFEEAITAMRLRQHEFNNHINAIKCLNYTIKEPEKLLSAQEQYCDNLLQENALNRLLRLHSDPVLIGFLYSKITTAEEKKYIINYKIQSVEIKEKVAVYELIEIIGILFDNAMEALEEAEKRIIVLKLIEEGNAFSLEVANISRVYRNSELEKFCTYGYSTKGERRGVGMSRVKELLKKSGATLLIQNCIYDGDNYLSFKIDWNKKLPH